MLIYNYEYIKVVIVVNRKQRKNKIEKGNITQISSAVNKRMFAQGGVLLVVLLIVLTCISIFNNIDNIDLKNSYGVIKKAEMDKSYVMEEETKIISSITNNGPGIITKEDDKINYKIQYIAQIENYTGNATITITDTLPYELDEQKINTQECLDGGNYSKEGKTIIWTEEINGIDTTQNNEIHNIVIEKNIEVVYKGIETEKENFVNIVRGKIQLDSEEKMQETDSVQKETKIKLITDEEHSVTLNKRNSKTKEALEGASFSIAPKIVNVAEEIANVKVKPSLEVEKRVVNSPENGDAYALGEIIEYEVIITNTGNVGLKEIGIIDELGKIINMTNSSIATYIAPRSFNLVKSLMPGESVTIKLGYEVTDEDIIAKSIMNKVDVVATALTPNEPEITVSDEVTSLVESAKPEIKITKRTISVPENEVAYDKGEVIRYEITVSNIGNITISNIQVTDELTGNISSKVLTIDSLKPGEEKKVNCEHTVTEEDLNAGKVENIATVKGTTNSDENPEVTGTSNRVEDPTIQYDTSNLKVIKEVQSTAKNGNAYDIGETVEYLITVKNEGNTTIENIKVTDELTENVGENSWNIPSLGGGESRTFTCSYVIKEKDLGQELINIAVAKTGRQGAIGSATVQTMKAGSIIVNKKIDSERLEFNTWGDLPYTVKLYVALFNDNELTQRISDIKEIIPQVEDSNTAQVIFEVLKFGTYYVSEVNERGEPLGDYGNIGYYQESSTSRFWGYYASVTYPEGQEVIINAIERNKQCEISNYISRQEEWSGEGCPEIDEGPGIEEIPPNFRPIAKLQQMNKIQQTTEDTTYGFTKVGESYKSNNVGKPNTKAIGVMQIDLRNAYKGLNVLVVNAEISSKTGNYGYIKVTEDEITQDYNYNNSSEAFVAITGKVGAKDYKIALQGGKKYNLIYEYENNEGKSLNVATTVEEIEDTFTINSVRIIENEAGIEDTIIQDTDEQGKIQIEVPYGIYTLTEIKEPKGYRKLEQPITIEIGPEGNKILENNNIGSEVTIEIIESGEFIVENESIAKVESTVIKDGSDKITSKDEEIHYKVTYKANIDNYTGGVTVTIIDTLPYKLDEEKMKSMENVNSSEGDWLEKVLDGGHYDSETNTITWTQEEQINEQTELKIEKDITVIFKDVILSEKTITNTVNGSLRLEETEQEMKTDTATHMTEADYIKDLKVTKKWDHGANMYERPTQITIKIKNKDHVEEEAILSEENNWSHIFKSLPKYDEDGNEIEYSIEEKAAEGEEGILEYYDMQIEQK